MIAIILECSAKGIRAASKEAITAGKRILDNNEDIIGIAIGAITDDVKSLPLNKIYHIDDSSLLNYIGENYAKASLSIISEIKPRILIMGATARGKDLLPRIAASLGVGLISDISNLETVEGTIFASKPIYASKAIELAIAKDEIKLYSSRPKMFPAVTDTGSPIIETRSFSASDCGVEYLSFTSTGSGKIELTEADIIVSGGRGMKGSENYPIIEELADTLGAAVGASRAAVDAGWRPHSDQVGQTGKTVAPTLYIACGISGAIQHLAGMGSSKVIVAINKDPEAPIFKVANYGIIGDLFKVVPALTEAIKSSKSE
jgi:electron transfer flavoprotein alpha subunit